MTKNAVQIADYLPNPKQEEWKWTNLNKVGSVDWHIAEKRDSQTSFEIDPVFEDSYQVLVLDSSCVTIPATLSDILKPSNIQPRQDKSLVQLNNQFGSNGLMLTIADDQILDKPIEIFYRGTSSVMNNHHLSISLGRNAKASVIEHFESEEKSFSNFVTDIQLLENSSLTHLIVQEEDKTSNHTNTVFVKADQFAKYQSFSLGIGAELSRRDIEIDMMGCDAMTSLSGVHLVDGKRLMDSTMVTNHLSTDGISKQHYKTVLCDQATGIFQGKIYVERDAQKTDGHQLNNALLLSDQAVMNSKPELEIYADDVKCAHGATTGQVDADSLFYLRSRGLNKAQARALLIEAFVGEVLSDIEDETMKKYCAKRVQTWLSEKL